MRNHHILLLIITLLFLPLRSHTQNSVEKLIRQGVKLHDSGKYKEAVEIFEQALQSNPNSMSATYELALSYLHMKDYENALKYSTKVINANYKPLLVDAYCVKSSALAELDRVEQSIALLNEALYKCGDEYLLHYNLGLSYFKQNNLDKALIHLKKAIEKETTHASAFLLYAYALNDSGRWVESFFSFHFFLLLEPNTERSKDVFKEMYNLLTADLPDDSPKLTIQNNIDRKRIYDSIKVLRPTVNTSENQFIFFEEATGSLIQNLYSMQSKMGQGLLWDFFLPVYHDIFTSGYFDAYCRYISVSYFPASLEWWKNNPDKVDRFIVWFEEGPMETEQAENPEADYGDDLDDEEIEE